MSDVRLTSVTPVLFTDDLAATVGFHAEVLRGPEVYRYGRREFSIRDPDGYRLVFSEPTSDPPTGVEE